MSGWSVQWADEMLPIAAKAHEQLKFNANAKVGAPPEKIRPLTINGRPSKSAPRSPAAAPPRRDPEEDLALTRPLTNGAEPARLARCADDQ
ncbi:MAG: hypothetical protein M3N48_15470, partial [Verrucomicrobiota bacterium]|nr:hypothetical protein [Verrucomicrobiota bacterium]